MRIAHDALLFDEAISAPHGNQCNERRFTEVLAHLSVAVG
jgi:hypothetical protein